MSAILCHECGRPNGAGAKSCIWCGVPIMRGGAVDIKTTSLEIAYLGGIERFPDAEPVRLSIGNEGVEVSELIPGTRSVKIPGPSIIEATCTDASIMIEPDGRKSSWWRAFWPSASRKETQEFKAYDYILTIQYKEDDEIRNAMFHREDQAGLDALEGLARVVNSVAKRWKNEG